MDEYKIEKMMEIFLKKTSTLLEEKMNKIKSSINKAVIN